MTASGGKGGSGSLDPALVCSTAFYAGKERDEKNAAARCSDQ